MANSADVNAGDDVLATQYNNLRADVLNTSTGHRHTGVSEDGRPLPTEGILDAAITLAKLDQEVLDQLATLQTQAPLTAVANSGTFADILNRSGKGRLNGIVLIGQGGSDATVEVRITVDSTVIITALSVGLQSGNIGMMRSDGEFSSVNSAGVDGPSNLGIEYTANIRVEYRRAGGTTTPTVRLMHSIVP